MNDYELLYLYKVEHNIKPFWYLYSKYQETISYVKKEVYRKFPFVPIEYTDLKSIEFFSFKKSVDLFNKKYNKSFSRYCLERMKWDLMNYFLVFIRKKHQVLNQALNIDFYLDNNECANNNFANIIKQQNQYYFIYKNIDLLTSVEKMFVCQRLKGKTNRQIEQTLNLNYKQIDKAFQRSVKKLKKAN